MVVMGGEAMPARRWRGCGREGCIQERHVSFSFLVLSCLVLDPVLVWGKLKQSQDMAAAMNLYVDICFSTPGYLFLSCCC